MLLTLRRENINADETSETRSKNRRAACAACICCQQQPLHLQQVPALQVGTKRGHSTTREPHTRLSSSSPSTKPALWGRAPKASSQGQLVRTCEAERSEKEGGKWWQRGARTPRAQAPREELIPRQHPPADSELLLEAEAHRQLSRLKGSSQVKTFPSH